MLEYWSIGLKGITPYSVTPVPTSQSVVGFCDGLNVLNGLNDLNRSAS